MWGRTVERYGLRLVEGYVDQISHISYGNVFQSCYPIGFCVGPPNREHRNGAAAQSQHATHIPHPPPGYYEAALMKRFDFIPDIVAAGEYPEVVDVFYSYRTQAFACSQFVHKSGFAFVQVMEDEKTKDAVPISNLTATAPPARDTAATLPPPSSSKTNSSGPGNGGFQWLTNRLATMRHMALNEKGRSKATERAETLRDELASFCFDSVRLGAFWEEERLNWERTYLRAQMPPQSPDGL